MSENGSKSSWWDRARQKAGAHIKWFEANPLSGVIGVLSAVLLGIWVAAELGGGRALWFLTYLTDNLPLTLPILTLLLALLLKPQDLAKLKGWLGLSSPLSLGLVNFAIWYLVTAQGSTKYIHINANNVLSTDYAVLFFILSFSWAGFCSVITALAEKATSGEALWRVGQVILLGFSVAAVSLPFAILESKASVEHKIGRSLDVRNFTVNIPFRDPSLNAHIGRSSDPLTECRTYTKIPARTRDEAITEAVKLFQESPAWEQKYPGQGKTRAVAKSVELLGNDVVAQEE